MLVLFLFALHSYQLLTIYRWYSGSIATGASEAKGGEVSVDCKTWKHWERAWEKERREEETHGWNTEASEWLGGPYKPTQ